MNTQAGRVQVTDEGLNRDIHLTRKGTKAK